MELAEQLQHLSNHLSHSISGTEATNQTPHSQTDCPKCGGTGWIWSRNEDGIPYCEECPCGIRKKIILQNQLQFAEMPEMYRDCTFANLRSNVYQSPDNKETFIQAARAVKYWLENIGEMQKLGIGLYICSSVNGSGKTRLACSMANELMQKYQKSVKFTTSLGILEEIKSTWSVRDNVTESKLIRDLTYADVLIIDDFGADSGKDWINEKFYGIINGRYVDRKITIFTSNYRISQLPYDDRITNRILERSYEIPFPEESVRKHIAEKARNNMIAAIQKGAK